MSRYQTSGKRTSNATLKHSVSHSLRRPLRERFSILELLENRVLLTTYHVTTPFDNGAGSLRDAITQANANVGADTIDFQMGGVGTIHLSSALPTITDALTLTGAVGAGGVPLVVLDGSGAGAGVDGLEVDAAGSTISGLSIVNFSGNGVVLATGGNTVQQSVISNNGNAGLQVSGDANQIIGNHIGTDASGSVAIGNGGNGVNLAGASHTVVHNNVISANGGNGVRVRAGDGNVIAGNFIGTDGTGAFAMANGGNGVMLDTAASNTVVGGAAAVDRNVISGNEGSGVYVGSLAGAGNQILNNYAGADASGAVAIANMGDGVTVWASGVLVSGNLLSGNANNGLSLFGDGNTVVGNRIGAAAGGLTALANQADGIWVQSNNNVIGVAGSGNVIAYNASTGVDVFFGAGNAIRFNSIFANQFMGIDLGADGATSNDANGHDGSNNNYQDYPVLGSMTNVNGVLTVTGTLSGDADATYNVDLYAASAVDGQGRIYLGSMNVMTDASGHCTFSMSVSNASTAGMDMVATATDSAGNTSEFSMTSVVPPAAFTNADTTTTLSIDKNPAIFGDMVTMTASVAASGGSLSLTGSVSFYETVNGSMVLLGSGMLSSNGMASFSMSSLAVGHHSIVAVYNADPGFNTSHSTAMDEAVSRDSSTTTMTSDIAVSTFGQALTFTVVVMPGHNFSGSPTGSVTFFDNGVAIGTVALSGNRAVLTTTSLAVGTHVITATYSGDTDFMQSSSGSITKTVKAPTQSGSISGHAYVDRTGNGLSSDDTAFGGVTIKLFRDTNNNGVYDNHDALVGSIVTGSDGAYSFSNLAAGKYFVVERLNDGYVRTAPVTSDYYTESMNGSVITGADFDNYKTSQGKAHVKDIVFQVNGAKTFNELRGHTHEGDTVTVKFTVKAGQSETMSFVSYTATGPHFDRGTASKEVVYNYQSGTFTAGAHDKTFTMTIKIPKSFYRVAFVGGLVIDHMGPAHSNIFYGAQGRLFAADRGGSHSPLGIVPIGGTVLN